MIAIRRAGVATLAVVVAGLVAGCGGKSRPPAGADESVSASTSPEEGAPAQGDTAPATPPATAPPAEAAGATSVPEEANHREVVLFFQRDDDDSLGPERRRILLTPSIADQARQIVNELAAGPDAKGLLPTVPRKTSVLGVYLDKRGTAFLDLSDEFVTMHPGGSSEEMATIFSIVDSLTYNLPEIRRVHFLVGGEERDTLHSHLDLRRSYLKDMSIVRMEEGG